MPDDIKVPCPGCCQGVFVYGGPTGEGGFEGFIWVEHADCPKGMGGRPVTCAACPACNGEGWNRGPCGDCDGTGWVAEVLTGPPMPADLDHPMNVLPVEWAVA